ncbi:MAG: hypothetical protein V3V25_03235 [Paracoccaceae bacterium]
MTSSKTDIIISALVFLFSIGLCAYLYGEILASSPVTGALYDSESYNSLGTAIWLGDELPGGRLALRGYFYPFIATAMVLYSPVLFVISQTLAISIGVYCLLKSERILTGKVWISPLALLSVSLLVSPASMMTEALGFTLAAAALLAFVAGPNRAWGVLFLVLAAMVKPAFLPVAVLSSVMVLRLNRTSIIVSILMLALVLPQLLATHIKDGKAQISNAGSSNFQKRFYPAVAGRVQTGGFVSYRSDIAVAAREMRPDLRDQIGFVIRHPSAAFKTWATILWSHHLGESSGFTNRDNAMAKGPPRDFLKTVSGVLNKIFAALIFPAIFGLAVYFRKSRFRSWPAGFIGPSIVVTAPLVYWQGDRVVFIGLLLLLPFAGLGIDRLFAFFRADPK